MKNFKPHFRFNKQERSGIFFLLTIIVFLQVGYFIYRSLSIESHKNSFSLDKGLQAKIDVLKNDALKRDSVKIYPFNPNYISDYKGYTLGMSVEEIDRLHAFRKQNKFANSPAEFQKVTLVSDSLLKVISPNFKFPEWTKKSKKFEVKSNQVAIRSSFSTSKVLGEVSSEKVKIKDLNSVTAQELKLINGIGEVLSKRIIKFRDRLGGFLNEEQLYDVYALESDVVKRVLRKYQVLNKPIIQKININTASVEEISSLIYISYSLAEEIVSYREVNGLYTTLNELENIEGFPANKIDRIALYLSL